MDFKLFSYLFSKFWKLRGYKHRAQSNKIKFFKNEAIKKCVQTNSADCLVKRYENDLLGVVFNQWPKFKVVDNYVEPKI